jgi:glutamyl-tRNA synthetase
MGGVRTALYNYLYAKKRGGDFILRIEDTDSQRFVPGAEEYIIEALAWCGILPDEGVENGKMAESVSDRHPHAPYRQSQRKALYRKYAEDLVERGFAYYAFDSSAELEELRKEAEGKGGAFTYNYEVRGKLRTSLNMSADECRAALDGSSAWVVRFKMPENRVVQMNDLIRGEIEVNTNTLDDKVLWKAADQLPTYHLANVVDDHLMEISDVIRGEEWLPSLPLHYMLYEAFGWNESRPDFAHLSLLLKPDGKGKLSKRDGDRLGFPVFPLEWKSPEGEVSHGYREDGYFPDAFINMLAFLGWNPGTEQEIFSLDELVEQFSIERVIKSGAKFNPEKARWYNHEYLRKKEIADIALDFDKILKTKNIDSSLRYTEEVCSLVRERASFVKEMWSLADYFYIAPTNYDEAVLKKFWKPETPAMLLEVSAFLKSLGGFSKEDIEHSLSDFIKSKEWPMGQIMNTLRLSLVGESKGPSVADIIALLGREETLLRIQRICEFIQR